MRIASLFVCLFLLAPPCGSRVFGQSGVARSRLPGGYGVNLSFAVFQFDAARSPAIDSVVRLTETFSSPEDESAFLKVKESLQDVAVRHDRLVGLTTNQDFSDAVLLGPEYMTIKVTPVSIDRGHIKLDLKARYANQDVLSVPGVEIDNFETVLLRGGKGMFGVKYYVGPGGQQETAPIERTLLVSVFPEIVPAADLRNRPAELSHPVDEYGSPLPLSAADRFTPPVVLERVVPRFETGRRINGAVVLIAVVGVDGKPGDVTVAHSIDPEIDSSAVDAFRKYRFSPALLNGKPVRATYREEISFARDLTAWEIEEQKLEEKKKHQPVKKPRIPRSTVPWPL